jgi:hypothetical protein
MLVVQVLHGVQCGLRCLNVSRNVQITKHAGSVSCSECLPLVTAITVINIILFVLGLGLGFSNSHTILLLIRYFRSLKLRIYCVPFSFVMYISHQMSHNYPTPFPSKASSNPPNTICCQHTIPVTYRSASLPLSCSQYSPQHSVPSANHQSHNWTIHCSTHIQLSHKFPFQQF